MADDDTDPVLVSLRQRRHRDREIETTEQRLKLAVPLVMAAAAIVGLVLVGFESKGIYSRPVDQLLAQKAAFVGRPVRVEGALVHGSLSKGVDGCDHRFVMTENKVELPVRYPKCVVPPDLKDLPDIDIHLTVEGELGNDGTLMATNVLTKCPSRYEKEQAAARGEKAPHRL